MQSTPIANPGNKELRMKSTSHTNVKEENGRYYARFSVNGRRYDGIKLEALTEDQAIKEFLELKIKAQASTEFKGPNATLKDVFHQYWADELQRAKKQKLSTSYISQNEKIFKTYIIPFYGNQPVMKMTSLKMWGRYCDNYDTVTDFSNHRKNLNLFLKWASNPDNGSYVGTIPEFPLPEHDVRSGVVHTDETLDRIYGCIDNHDLRDLFQLLRLTGRRRMEIQALTWDRVDFKAGKITTRDNDTKTKRKTTIPVLPEVLEILKIRAITARSKFVFAKPDNLNEHYHTDFFKNILKIALIKAGISDFEMRDLRSSFGVLLKNKYHLTDDDIAAYMGHTKAVHRARYDQEQEAAKNRVLTAMKRTTTVLDPEPTPLNVLRFRRG